MSKRRTQRAEAKRVKRIAMGNRDLVMQTQISMPVQSAYDRVNRDVEATEARLKDLHDARRVLREYGQKHATPEDGDPVLTFRHERQRLSRALLIVQEDIIATGVELRRLKESRDRL